MLLNEKNRKIDELENLISEQTSRYYTQFNKNHKLNITIKQFKEEYDNLRLQVEDLYNFIEEKDAKIMELDETIKGQDELILRKNLEIKNKQMNKPMIKINNPLATTQMQIDKSNNPNLQQENIFDLSTYSINRENEETEEVKQ